MNRTLPALRFLSEAVAAITASCGACGRGVGNRVHERIDAIGEGGCEPAFARERERRPHAEDHRFAVPQRAVPARFLERVSDGVAEVEDRAPAGAAVVALALIAGHHARLGRDTARDRYRQHLGIGRQRARQLAFEIEEQFGIGDQRGLQRLADAGREIARIERRERRRIDGDERRMMEHADEVLAGAEIDRGLSADRGVDRGEQRRRHGAPAQTAQKRRRDEPAEIGHRAAADRDQHGVAVDVRRGQPIVELAGQGPRLDVFAADEAAHQRHPRTEGRDHAPRQRFDRDVVDHDDRARLERGELVDRAGTDHDVVGAFVAQIDPHAPAVAGDHARSPTSSTARSASSTDAATPLGASEASTIRCAWR